MYTRRSASVASVAALAGLCVSASTAAIAAARERHPSIRRADGDFGGHRVEAMAAIDRAMEQLALAERFDRR